MTNLAIGIGDVTAAAVGPVLAARGDGAARCDRPRTARRGKRRDRPLARHSRGPGAVPCLRRGGQDAQPGHIINEFKAKAELAKTDVEMIFGRRQIVIDGSYHPLRAFSGPEL
jgi:hypothetical protein